MPGQPRAADGNLRISLRAAAWRSMIVAAGLLAVGGLRMGAVVFAPIVLGLVLALLLKPVAQWLGRWMPRWVACSITLVLPAVALLIAGWFVWYGGQQAADRARSINTEQYAQAWQQTRVWLTDHGVPERWLPSTEDDNQARAAPQNQAQDSPLLSEDMRARLLRIVLGGLGTLAGGLVAVGFSLAFCMFALLEAPRWRAWTESWTSPARSAYALSLTAHYGVQVRRYLFAKTITGIVSGAATWLFVWIMGVPLAHIWGGLTFLLNFIPNIGALLSGVPPILLAFAELGLAQGLIVAAGLILIELLSGNLLEPLLEADFLKLSPFLMLASLLFWGWVWGILGAVLAPMLTAAAVAAVEQVRLKPRAGDGEDAPLA